MSLYPVLGAFVQKIICDVKTFEMVCFAIISIIKGGLFDCELANAVQGITILACWPFAYNKPFTQFEAYYVMLCNTSFVNWQDCFRQVKTLVLEVGQTLKEAWKK